LTRIATFHVVIGAILISGCAVKMVPVVKEDLGSTAPEVREETRETRGPNVTTARIQGPRVAVQAEVERECRTALVELHDLRIGYAPKPPRAPWLIAVGGALTAVTVASAVMIVQDPGFERDSTRLALMAGGYSVVPAIVFDATLIRTAIRSGRTSRETQTVVVAATPWEPCSSAPYAGTALARIAVTGQESPLSVVLTFDGTGTAEVDLAVFPPAYAADLSWRFDLAGSTNGIPRRGDGTRMLVTGGPWPESAAGGSDTLDSTFFEEPETDASPQEE
jgi:hypothetical protein